MTIGFSDAALARALVLACSVSIGQGACRRWHLHVPTTMLLRVLRVLLLPPAAAAAATCAAAVVAAT